MMLKRILKFIKKSPKDRLISLQQNYRILRNKIIFYFFDCINKYSAYCISEKPMVKVCGDHFISLWRSWTFKNNFNAGDYARFHFIVNNLSMLNKEGVAGDLVELGVYKGNSAKLMATFKESRSLYLYDTFEGFDNRDLVRVDKKFIPGFSDTSLEGVKDFMGLNDGSIKFIPGYFPESIPDIAHQICYAFVHIDCDLYLPSKAALEFFYPRLSPGGIIFIHDYYSGHWDGIKKSVDEFIKTIPENIIILPDVAGSAVIRKAKLLS